MTNPFIEAMKFRHATKEFDANRKISDEEFNSILEIGRLSPSSFGFEPWKFLVIQDPLLREKMQPFAWGAQGQLPTASHIMILLTRKTPSMHYGSDYIQHMMHDVKQLPEDVVPIYSQFYEKFQKEDFNLLESDRAMNDWATKQTYIALANMMTGAAFMGIDSCPMEGFDVAETEAFLQEELKVDMAEYGPSVMLAFGYRKEEPRAKTRQAMTDIVTWI